MDNKLIGAVLVTAIVVGGGSFYGGMKYQESKVPAMGQRFAQGQQGQNPFGQARQGGQMGQGMRAGTGLINGEVVSKDDSSVTLKLTDGGSKIIFYNASTTVSKQSSGTLADITTGTTIVVSGKADKDGSITAGMMQIRPAGERMPNMPRMPMAPTSTQN
ncbi:MAG: hypothetical protein U0487_03850 [Patescibacteria group bacterium]